MTLFTYGEYSFFAESDAGEEEEARAIEQIDRCEAVVLSRGGSDKVNQHVQDISASSYIISTDKVNPPSKEMTETLRGNLYATYNSGTIKFEINGEGVTSNLDSDNRIES